MLAVATAAWVFAEHVFGWGRLDWRAWGLVFGVVVVADATWWLVKRRRENRNNLAVIRGDVRE